LFRSKMSFHQALDLIFELDEMAVRCTQDILRQIDCLDWFIKVPYVIPTFVVIEGESDMVIKDLDLELNVDVMMMDFLE
ncbi:hypothetical protein Tco_0414754, partial [Tanacetum coccineum]